ncbi:MAG: PTS sugar transporter subunit IIA [Acetobacteraceae bacterium]|nr:PTS sugar transporter subunit IIA [Pseudomonadota bacterium]
MTEPAPPLEIAHLLTERRVALNLRVRDKRGLISELARLAASDTPEVGATVIEQALQARERLGSTGLGAGFALPHARVEGLHRFVGLFVRLPRPVDFEAIDGKPVHTLFTLLIPAEAADHVGILAAIARRFRDPDLRAKMHAVRTPAEALALLTAA